MDRLKMTDAAIELNGQPLTSCIGAEIKVTPDGAEATLMLECKLDIDSQIDKVTVLFRKN